MDYIIIFLVCFFSSVIGAICGIGGGVIIKPVLDAAGILSVTTVSFLSGCTVLSMSVVSMYKSLRSKHTFEFDKRFATVIAMGGVVGGLTGKWMYERVIGMLTDTSKVGGIQAAVLFVITLATLLYTIYKDRIKAKHITNLPVVFVVGVLLGIFSSFLGIGGGPINLALLLYLFSMESKQAAMYSIYIIMFSQIAGLISTLVQGNVPTFELPTLLLMIACGILGGFVGSKINQKIDDRTEDRLFIGLMGVIIVINIFNIYRYLLI